MTELQFPIPELTEKQRDKVREFYAANPKGGYKSALAHADIHVSKAVAKATILADDDLADEPFRILKVDERTALAAIGEILSDPKHKDRIRAAEAALKMLWGYGEKQSLEVSGPEGGPLQVQTEDKSASLPEVLAMLKKVGADDDPDDGGGTPDPAVPAA